jgi:hypothetical protein
MLADVTSSSSAAIIAKTVQRRTLNRSASSGVRLPSGSCEIRSARMEASRIFIVLRIEASSETSALNA